jgi:hypothetical protein
VLRKRIKSELQQWFIMTLIDMRLDVLLSEDLLMYTLFNAALDKLEKEDNE